ncbi:MAG: hypothetical protein ACKPKO_50730, partial [Candidatus Fonsibacter sp.]
LVTRGRLRHDVTAQEPLEAWFEGLSSRWNPRCIQAQLRVDPRIHSRRTRLTGLLLEAEICIDWGLNFYEDFSPEGATRRAEVQVLMRKVGQLQPPAPQPPEPQPPGPHSPDSLTRRALDVDLACFNQRWDAAVFREGH